MASCNSQKNNDLAVVTGSSPGPVAGPCYMVSGPALDTDPAGVADFACGDFMSYLSGLPRWSPCQEGRGAREPTHFTDLAKLY